LLARFVLNAIDERSLVLSNLEPSVANAVINDVLARYTQDDGWSAIVRVIGLATGDNANFEAPLVEFANDACRRQGSALAPHIVEAVQPRSEQDGPPKLVLTQLLGPVRQLLLDFVEEHWRTLDREGTFDEWKVTVLPL
jgi:hypothetical protein